MKPKPQEDHPDLFQTRLDQILDMSHPLCVLSRTIDWSFFEEEFGRYYSENQGSPGKPIRLLVGLHYLKHTFDESDESVLARFLENPYWQYLCGYVYFQHRLPLDSSTLSYWRKRVGESGMEKLLQALLSVARKRGYLKVSDMNQVNVDTTVQEKAIAFPTDARLYHKMRKALVRSAESNGIKLRQSYRRVGKKALAKQGRYAHARQMKRAARETKRLKTYLGRVYRDIKRKATVADEGLHYLLTLAERLLAQQKDSKNKLYSIHEPDVDCISKGKPHKRYEFGCKVGMVTTSKSNWIIGIKAFDGNPYDGHTLEASLVQAEQLTTWRPKCATVDLGYRGHGYEGEVAVRIVNYRTMKKQTRSVRRWFKRRAAIEPIFGHLKSDNRMRRNQLKGKEGDKINALLSACGFNFRKLYKAFFLPEIIAIHRRLREIQKLFWGKLETIALNSYATG